MTLHPCENCPQIQNEINERLSAYGDSDINNNPEWKECIMWQICESCWCDKFGSRIWHTDPSGCENYKSTATIACLNRQKTSTKRSRYKKHQNKLKHLNAVCQGSPSPVRYKNQILVKELGYVKNPKPHYKRCYRGKGALYHKRYSNRKIRHYKGIIQNGWWCHKLYDFLRK